MKAWGDLIPFATLNQSFAAITRGEFSRVPNTGDASADWGVEVAFDTSPTRYHLRFTNLAGSQLEPRTSDTNPEIVVMLKAAYAAAGGGLPGPTPAELAIAQTYVIPQVGVPGWALVAMGGAALLVGGLVWYGVRSK